MINGRWMPYLVNRKISSHIIEIRHLMNKMYIALTEAIYSQNCQTCIIVFFPSTHHAIKRFFFSTNHCNILEKNIFNPTVSDERKI